MREFVQFHFILATPRDPSALCRGARPGTRLRARRFVPGPATPSRTKIYLNE
jgi:hypothetical protein